VNDQQFTAITEEELVSNYGNNNLKTDGWKIGDYTFQVKTKSSEACGLDAASEAKTLKIRKEEIACNGCSRRSNKSLCQNI
jgi:hypothetical protein